MVLTIFFLDQHLFSWQHRCVTHLYAIFFLSFRFINYRNLLFQINELISPFQGFYISQISHSILITTLRVYFYYHAFLSFIFTFFTLPHFHIFLHSLLKDFTGFANPAFTDWNAMVTPAIKTETSIAMINIPALRCTW